MQRLRAQWSVARDSRIPSAQQHVNVGMSVLIPVPVVDPVVGHAQNADLGNRADCFDGQQGWFAGDPVPAQGHRLPAQMGQPKRLGVGRQFPAVFEESTGGLLQQGKTVFSCRSSHAPGAMWCHHGRIDWRRPNP